MKLKDCIHFLNKLFIQKIFNSIKNVYYPSHLTPVRGSFPGILGGVSLQCGRITINKTVWHWCTSCKESKECYWPILFIESTNDVIWTGWKSIVAHSTHPFSLSGLTDCMLIPFYGPEWREACKELTFWPKNTTQWPWDYDKDRFICHSQGSPWGYGFSRY